MQVTAAALGAIEGVVGLYISFWWAVASGGTIVSPSTAVFFAVFGVRELSQLRRREHPVPVRPATHERGGVPHVP